MITLPDITLVAISGIGYQTEENINALNKSQEGIKFGEVKYIQLGNIVDIDTWNKAVIYELPKHIHTKYCLLVHGDGYVIHPDMWDDNWLDYDYIGAPWPLPQDDYSYRDKRGNIIRVGNSVSLRSKALLDLPNELRLPWRSYFGNTNEDGFICCHNRHYYERAGLKFAPLDVAKYFSKEREIPENVGLKTFAFHL